MHNIFALDIKFCKKRKHFLYYFKLFLPGNWRDGYRCGKGLKSIKTTFDGNYVYSLEEAKEKCSHDCDSTKGCVKANLYHTSNYQKCTLHDFSCKNENARRNYYYYHKSIKNTKIGIHN